MTERSHGIAEARDDDAAILSQENGKVRFEAWVDSLVCEIRWKLALRHTDEVDAGEGARPAPGHPGDHDRRLPAARSRHGHRAVQLADRDPGRRAPPCTARGQHRDRQATALRAAGHDPRRAAHRRAAAARRPQRGDRHRREHVGADPTTPTSRRSASRARSAAASDHGDGLGEALTRVTLELGGNDAAVIPRRTRSSTTRISIACSRRSTTPPARSA